MRFQAHVRSESRSLDCYFFDFPPLLPDTPPMATADPTHATLTAHIQRLRACTRCPRMLKPVVSGGPVVSRVLLVGQAPGDKEPVLGLPFVWTAGKTLFRWFEENCDLTEAQFRAGIYMASVCRCFPGKRPEGGDRVPAPEEIQHCSTWLEAEYDLLQPQLVIPVGKLAISQFLPESKLEEVIGKHFTVRWRGHTFDLIPLPHPSGASPWHRLEPGLTLLQRAMQKIAAHPAMKGLPRR